MQLVHIKVHFYIKAMRRNHGSCGTDSRGPHYNMMAFSLDKACESAQSEIETECNIFFCLCKGSQ